MRWDKNGERLDARLTKEVSKGRVQIDTLSLLNFRSARVSDSATYDCWYGSPRRKRGVFFVEGRRECTKLCSCTQAMRRPT